MSHSNNGSAEKKRQQQRKNTENKQDRGQREEGKHK
jgi:hypothetical protein